MITGTKGDAVTGQWSTHGIELLADRCCGCLTAVVQRFGGVVRWSEWEVPAGGSRPVEFDFEAGRYEAELARVAADPRWRSAR